jgi:nucleoside-diphosphate-sugar epimerase
MVERELPQRFRDEAHLEEVMTTPDAGLVAVLGRVWGDIRGLGAGGKLGPTRARMARRAAPAKRVVAVARFSDKDVHAALTAQGVDCVEADLLDRAAVARLPDAPNVIYMAGRKFGSAGAEDLTWAMNALVPALVAERYAASRIVVFSTGCVYPFVDVTSGGAAEDMSPVPPPGEYAASCVARERLFQYGSRVNGTKGCLFRLNYAIDMRYGVLHDVAQKVMAGQPIDLASGHVNVIWQGDANAFALRALAHAEAPMRPLNVTGPETISVRWLAAEFGRRLGKAPVLSGTEATLGWLANAQTAFRLFGYPTVALGQMIDWTADWVSRGQASHGKPTGYDVRSGKF